LDEAFSTAAAPPGTNQDEDQDAPPAKAATAYSDCYKKEGAMKYFLTSTLVLLGMIGCSSGPGTPRALSGQIDTAQVQLTNARVIARSAAGRVFHAPIAADGTFKLSLPTNERYSIRFANATTNPKFFDAFAVLTSTRANGLRTHWYTLTPGGDISLGRVSRAPAAFGGATASSTASDTPDDSEDPAEQEEDDEVEVCDVDDGQDQVEVEGEHDLLDDVDSDRDGTSDSVDSDDDRDECTASNVSDDDCETSEAEEQELDDDSDAACSDGGDGSPPPPPPPPPAPGVIIY
jgi:hypothetical protein